MRDRYREGFEDGWDQAKEQFRRELADRVAVALKPVTVAPGSYARPARDASPDTPTETTGA